MKTYKAKEGFTWKLDGNLISSVLYAPDDFDEKRFEEVAIKGYVPKEVKKEEVKEPVKVEVKKEEVKKEELPEVEKKVEVKKTPAKKAVKKD